MFIQTEATPNPNVMKFIPGRTIVTDTQKNFPNEFDCVENAEQSPFAKRLLHIQGIVSVYLGADFVSVTKTEECEWYVLKPLVLGAIMEHFVNEFPIFKDEATSTPNAAEKTQSDDPVEQQIIELLDTRVRPAVAQDGGDIIFDRFVGGVVYLKMKGACAGCPSSTATLKSGIENMLKFYIPEVEEVTSVEA